MGQIGILLLTAQALTALSLGLILEVGVLIGVFPALLTVLFDALGLGLLVGSSLGLRGGLGLSSLLGLLALYLGVLCGVP